MFFRAKPTKCGPLPSAPRPRVGQGADPPSCPCSLVLSRRQGCSYTCYSREAHGMCTSLVWLLAVCIWGGGRLADDPRVFARPALHGTVCCPCGIGLTVGADDAEPCVCVCMFVLCARGHKERRQGKRCQVPKPNSFSSPQRVTAQHINALTQRTRPRRHHGFPEHSIGPAARSRRRPARRCNPVWRRCRPACVSGVPWSPGNVRRMRPAGSACGGHVPAQSRPATWRALAGLASNVAAAAASLFLSRPCALDRAAVPWNCLAAPPVPPPIAPPVPPPRFGERHHSGNAAAAVRGIASSGGSLNTSDTIKETVSKVAEKVRHAR